MGEGHEYWDGRGWTTGAEAPAQAGQPAERGPRGYSRSTIVVVAVGMTVLLLATAAAGVYALGSQFPDSTTATAVTTPAGSTAASSAPSPVASPAHRATPAPVKKTQPAVVSRPVVLTARLSGTYCPVARVGDTACWHGGLKNTGPRIGRLALIFVVGGGYTNWFATHEGAMLSGFFTTAGCTVDAGHARIVCGSVPAGGSVSVYLEGGVSKVGHFNYAVKFADISSGRTVYVDQNANGTHQVVAWSETITA